MVMCFIIFFVMDFGFVGVVGNMYYIILVVIGFFLELVIISLFIDMGCFIDVKVFDFNGKEIFIIIKVFFGGVIIDFN